MAGGTHLVHGNEQSVTIAIDMHSFDVLDMPGGITLTPVFLP
jgi:hypothetical protein